MRRLDHRTRVDRIEREVACFGLGSFFDDLTETYSHGMKQRLVFAAALLHDPRVLVIDEPMVGLDPRSVRLAKDMLWRGPARVRPFSCRRTSLPWPRKSPTGSVSWIGDA